ncbi:ester cyclase [Arenicella xantha]|uniref:Putative ester cyclase n=1 Tax=Arenicella xantha TaxID=644221 RepID=A0A395JFG3_9GAMM|nr:ester cyclase [Arenicella xantha]RBP47070.1 putative ester cyclase [Arenicella xantha]
MSQAVSRGVCLIAIIVLTSSCVRKEVDAVINKEATRIFFNGVFNDGITDIVKLSLADNYTYNGHPSKVDGTINWAKSLRAAYPDLHFTINDLIGEGHKVAIRWTMTGTGSDGVKMTTSGTNIITFKDGKAVSNWQNGGTSADLHPASAGT